MPKPCPYEVHLLAPSGQRRTLYLQIFQRASDTIVEAFQTAQIDPEQAAKIQEIAAALKAIRDRPRR